MTNNVDSTFMVTLNHRVQLVLRKTTKIGDTKYHSKCSLWEPPQDEFATYIMRTGQGLTRPFTSIRVVGPNQRDGRSSPGP